MTMRPISFGRRLRNSVRRVFVPALLLASAPPIFGQEVKTTDDIARAFFAKHCQGCHEGKKPKGGFRLESLAADFEDKANRERWLDVLEKLKDGSMPPKEKPRPPAPDVQAVSAWIRTQVDQGAAASTAAKGRVGLRRLNRTEYENTIRDL